MRLSLQNTRIGGREKGREREGEREEERARRG